MDEKNICNPGKLKFGSKAMESSSLTNMEEKQYEIYGTLSTCFAETP
jgi:hypothetical protein